MPCLDTATGTGTPVPFENPEEIIMRKILLLPMLALAVGGGVASSASAATTHASANVVHITAMASGLMYDKKVVTAKAGKITIDFTNLSTALRHNVRIELGETELGGTKTIGHGSTSTVVTLKKGTYHFYCSVPGHEDAGMSGTLNVT
jgi:plastocyanin